MKIQPPSLNLISNKQVSHVRENLFKKNIYISFRTKPILIVKRRNTAQQAAKGS